MDRRLVLLIVAGVAVVAAAAGWFAGQRIKSPAEVAAEAAAPEPSTLTVPVELRTLSQDVVVRGTVNPSDETELLATSVSGSSVITRLPKEAGDQIEEGDVLVEVAGRPIIALQGRLPAFRNMIPGLDGPEVVQLEEALVRLGYDPGDVDTTYTTSTAAAVEALYRDRGYTPPESDPGDVATLEGAEASVEQAQQQVTASEAALAEAKVAVTDTERTRLDLDVAEAELGLTQARKAADAARAEAAEATSAAQTARDDAAATAAADPSAENQQALADAEAALAAATDAGSDVGAEQDLLVKRAELAVEEAKQARTDRLAPQDLGELETGVSDARAALTDARADVAEAEGLVGAPLPAAEVVFFSSLPRQVGMVLAEVSDEPSGPVMTISGAETLIESGMPAADRSLVELGNEAILTDDDLGISLNAVVTFVADQPGGPGLSDDRYAMRLEPTEQVPEEAIGLNLRVTIPITSSGGDVLAVPLAALSAGADGTARVEVERSVGDIEVLDVATGLRAGGLVEIRPLDGSLSAGDRVVVGRDLVLPGSGGEDEADEGEDGDS